MKTLLTIFNVLSLTFAHGSVLASIGNVLEDADEFLEACQGSLLGDANGNPLPQEPAEMVDAHQDLDLYQLMYGERLDAGMPQRPIHADPRNYDLSAAVFASLQGEEGEADRARKQEEMNQIRRHLHKDMALFDVPGLGRCGYYAALAIRSTIEHPERAEIVISMENLNECLQRVCNFIATRISPEDIEIWGAILASNPGYFEQGKIRMDILLADLSRGEVEVDDMILKFLREILSLPPDIIMIKDTDETALKIFQPHGELIHCGTNHFMVALPKVTSTGLPITAVKCQETDGQWWNSQETQPSTPVQGDLRQGTPLLEMQSERSKQGFPLTRSRAIVFSENPEMEGPIVRNPTESAGAGNPLSREPMATVSSPQNVDWHQRPIAVAASDDDSVAAILARKQEKMNQILTRLPDDKVLFDVPDFGRCGYYSCLAILFAMNCQKKPTIEISKRVLEEYLQDLYNRIYVCIEDGNISGDLISELVTSLCNSEKYYSQDTIAWEEFFADLWEGNVQNTILLEFLCQILELSRDSIQFAEDTEVMIPEFSHAFGMLIHCDTGHFMFALPKEPFLKTTFKYQEIDGQWWISRAGQPAIEEPKQVSLVPLPVAVPAGSDSDQGSHTSIGESAQDFPMPLPVSPGTQKTTDSSSQRSMPIAARADDLEAALLASQQEFKEEVDRIERQKKMDQIQARLHKDMALFDVPAFGRCGYYAGTAIWFMINYPKPVIEIPWVDLQKCLNGLSVIISTHVRDWKNGSPKNQEIIDALELLMAIFMSNGQYLIEDEVDWDTYLSLLSAGEINLNDILMIFLRMRLNFHPEVIFIEDTDREALGRFHPCGAIIHCDTDHFIVALPKGITAVKCQEIDGRWWISQEGKAACSQ
ncbi:MAG: hypothetical protein LBR92_04500 [Puniceicoccales bacterium]|jgi:hypothetical protein|nr:hypothetical protein [Puniceicoccales bacterium]